MPKRLQLKLPFDSDLSDHIKNNFSDIEEYRIISKSLDARGAPRGKKPIFQYTLETLVAGEQFEHLSETVKPLTPSKNPPIWIGAGPAGLFGALRLTEHGLPSIIIERGEVATKRMLFIAKFWRYGEFNNESNVCYGEGGAGLFSDGKLITRIKSPFVKYVMQKFVDFGAPAETGYMSNPHLGSNKIRKIITQMSDHLHSKGCKIYYNTRVDEILFENTADSKKAIGVLLNNGEKLYSDHIVLATGHSAKEMYAHLLENDVAIKGKDFAVGVRIEHPREVIDKIQHGDFCASPVLGSAKYKLTHHNRDSRKGTYSFCMCPGGYVLSSGTEIVID